MNLDELTTFPCPHCEYDLLPILRDEFYWLDGTDLKTLCPECDNPLYIVVKNGALTVADAWPVPGSARAGAVEV